MSELFIALYLYFRKRKPLFYLFLAVMLVLILVPASKIHFREDISGLSGTKNEAGIFDKVVSRIKFSNKLIVRFSNADSSALPDPELLVNVAKLFSDSLERRFDSTYIRSFTGNLNDSATSSGMALLSAHLPVYLDEPDYRHIDSLITPPSVHVFLEQDYKTLLTPAGFSLKNSILGDPLGITNLSLNKLKSLQAGDNFEVFDGFIVTKDHRNLLLFLTPSNPASETSKNEKLLTGIDEVTGNLAKARNNGFKADYFGAVAFSVGNARQVKKDIWLSLSIAIFLIILLIGWYFRSWKIPLLGFLPAVFGGGLALAVLYLMKGTVSSIAMGIGSVILGLIVDYALYLINHFRKKGNILVVLREMTLTILLCSLTTAGAFLCLIFLRSAVLNDLGWFAAISVTGAAFFSLIILPHFLTEKDRKSVDKVNNPIDRIAGFSFEKNIMAVSLVLLAIAAAIFYLPKARFEEDMMRLNFVPERLKIMEREMDKITDASAKTVYLVSTGMDLNHALESREKIDQQLRQLKGNGLILSYSGTNDLLFSDSMQHQKILRWNAFWTNEKKEKVLTLIAEESEKLGFRTHSFDRFTELMNKDFRPLDKNEMSLLKTSILADYLTETRGLSMVTTLIKVKKDSIQGFYHTFTCKPGNVVFDKQMLTQRFVSNVRHDFDLLVRLSMIFVTLLLLLSFGRVETGLITSLPMFISWLLTLGFMGITGITFNIFNIIVSSFIFGLGVDYSILMTRGLLFEYKYRTHEIASYKTSIILSASTTLFGVGALFFARHPALNSIAMISIFGISVVVIITFTLQQLIIRWFLINRLKKGVHPITLRIMIKTLITWGNIVFIAILQVVLGTFIFLLAPVSRKKKQMLFHRLFSFLCKTYMMLTFPTNRKVSNPFGEDFSKPAVIIGNHQSLIETPAFLQLHPKIIMLTNDWVWNSPLFGPVARMASYFNSEHGIDSILDKLKEKVDEGYSVIIFPEGHRSDDNRVHRFHRGAFYLAEKLKMDILPVVVFGTGEFLAKGVFWGRHSGVRMKILRRVSADDPSMGSGYSERSKAFRRLIQKEYSELMATEGTGHYYRKKLILNYIYKGPVLEWYLRVKLVIEKFYQRYNELIPRNAEVLDLGCGYGFMAYMLNMTAPGRRITGVDYDEEKIRVAQNAVFVNDHLDFHLADITTYDFTPKDVILLSDVLHYLSFSGQEELLNRCIERLNPGGMIIIRDADSEASKKHKRTKATEFFSTRITGFNKTTDNKKELHFTSLERINKIISRQGLVPEVIREERHTSNFLVIIRK